jgi:hypothetical protein
MKGSDSHLKTRAEGSRRAPLLGLLRAVVVLALILGSLEVSGLVYCKVLLDLDHAAAAEEKRSIYDLLPSLQIADRDHLEEVGERLPALTLNRPHELHPYLGYVFEHGGRTTNNLGFPASVDYPYRAQEAELVIGLFGGSVAQQLGEDEKSRELLERRIAELAEPLGVRSARVILFALSGWKQPQTFFAFSYFFQFLDMAIFWDGANEVNQRQMLPWRGLYRHLVARHLSQQAQIAIGEIAYRSRDLAQWTSSFSKPVLSNSLFAHAIWRAYAYRGLDEIQRLREQLDEEDPALAYDGDVAKTGHESRVKVEEYFAFFEQASRWQALLSKRAGKPYYHFLQPTKLLRGSKPLSQTELAKLELNPDREKAVERWSSRYRELETMLAKLRAEGVEAHSTTDVFQDVDETIYLDNVHLNAAGRMMLAERMADTIGASLAEQLKARVQGQLASRSTMRLANDAEMSSTRPQRPATAR